MFFYDSTYILVILAVVISALASSRVNATFAKYSRERSRSGLTGAETASRLLRSQGINDVAIERVNGDLTDHYDPGRKVLRLSQSVYDSTSLSAISVAAHECGHAVQHAKGYVPLVARTYLVPVANFGAKISWPLFLIGIFIGGTTSNLLMLAGIALFCMALLFQVITLPVEFNASSRALVLMQEQGILYEDEQSKAKKMLSAAAMTYVASVLGSLLQLLRLLVLRDRHQRR